MAAEKKVKIKNPENVPLVAKEESKTANDKYYKKFDFFYKRTCFRLMSEFYKLLFAPFQKQWVDQKKRSSVP